MEESLPESRPKPWKIFKSNPFAGSAEPVRSLALEIDSLMVPQQSLHATMSKPKHCRSSICTTRDSRKGSDHENPLVRRRRRDPAPDGPGDPYPPQRLARNPPPAGPGAGASGGAPRRRARADRRPRGHADRRLRPGGSGGSLALTPDPSPAPSLPPSPGEGHPLPPPPIQACFFLLFSLLSR